MTSAERIQLEQDWATILQSEWAGLAADREVQEALQRAAAGLARQAAMLAPNHDAPGPARPDAAPGAAAPDAAPDAAGHGRASGLAAAGSTPQAPAGLG